MAPDEVTGIVLCGGKGQRLGGIEKPLVQVGDRCLLDFVLERLRPQVSRTILSVAANSDDFSAFGCEVVRDAQADQGPLGGLVSAFRAVETEWMLTVPGDAPWTATCLVQRLARDAAARGVAVASDGQRRQNLTMLIHKVQATSLSEFFEAGGRAVHRWFTANTLPATDLSDLAASFVNINTPADLEAFQCAAQNSG